MLKLEYQYFEGCPHHKIMWENLTKAIEGLETEIALNRIEVKTNELAIELGFRGSPTLLINDIDIENLPMPVEPSLFAGFIQMASHQWKR